METPKTYPTNDKIDLVQETASIYETNNKIVLENSEKLHPILEKLLLRSKQDAKDGKGISHSEMMRKVKLKYPFLK